MPKAINQGLSIHNPLLQIVVWNLMPLIGVLFLGWDPFSVPLCYALESIVIGVFNSFKLTAVCFFGKKTESIGDMNSVGLLAVVFFVSSFSLLLLIQFYSFFHAIGLVADKQVTIMQVMQHVITREEVSLLFTTFAVLNAFSFVTEFILPGRYAERTISEQFQEPFPRILVVQFLIAIGGMLYVYTGNKFSMLLVLMLLKTATEYILTKYKIGELFSW
jgi:hypothetical protein